MTLKHHLTAATVLLSVAAVTSPHADAATHHKAAAKSARVAAKRLARQARAAVDVDTSILYVKTTESSHESFKPGKNSKTGIKANDSRSSAIDESWQNADTLHTHGTFADGKPAWSDTVIAPDGTLSFVNSMGQDETYAPGKGGPDIDEQRQWAQTDYVQRFQGQYAKGTLQAGTTTFNGKAALEYVVPNNADIPAYPKVHIPAAHQVGEDDYYVDATTGAPLGKESTATVTSTDGSVGRHEFRTVVDAIAELPSTPDNLALLAQRKS